MNGTQPGLFDTAEVWAGPYAQPAGHHIRMQMADGTWKERLLHDLDDPIILTMNARVIYARGERRPSNREYVAGLCAWSPASHSRL